VLRKASILFFKGGGRNVPTGRVLKAKKNSKTLGTSVKFWRDKLGKV
jgi:hypothetical protein